MATTLNFSTNIQLTINQLVELARQLPQKERIELASMIIADEPTLEKNEIKAKKEGLEDAKLHREGKIKLRTLAEFIADV